MHCEMARPARSRTMLSKPLAHPSTLDRRRPMSVRCPAWRGSGAGRSCAVREIHRQKPRLIQQRIQPARCAEGPFSLGRGLESGVGFLKLGITPCWLWAETTKATLSDRLRSVVMWLEN